jgi:hypothetical protein
MTFKLGSPEHLASFQKRAKAGQLTKDEKAKLTSIHEAAHACVLIDSGLVVDRATIIPAPGENGSVGAPFPVTFENFQTACIAILAAGILESTFSGTSNISGDLAELRRLSFHFSLSQDQFLEVFGLLYNSAGEWLVEHFNQVIAVASSPRRVFCDEPSLDAKFRCAHRAKIAIVLVSEATMSTSPYRPHSLQGSSSPFRSPTIRQKGKNSTMMPAM